MPSAIGRGPAGHVGVQGSSTILPAGLNGALALVFRQGEGVDDGAGVVDLGDGRSKKPLPMSISLGWMSVLPSRPRSRPSRHSSRKPSRSLMSL